jgi:hypothetical protein
MFTDSRIAPAGWLLHALPPKTNANGVRNQFYDNMRRVARGDVVFSYWDTRKTCFLKGGYQTGWQPFQHSRLTTSVCSLER